MHWLAPHKIRPMMERHFSILRVMPCLPNNVYSRNSWYRIGILRLWLISGWTTFAVKWNCFDHWLMTKSGYLSHDLCRQIINLRDLSWNTSIVTRNDNWKLTWGWNDNWKLIRDGETAHFMVRMATNRRGNNNPMKWEKLVYNDSWQQYYKACIQETINIVLSSCLQLMPAILDN